LVRKTFWSMKWYTNFSSMFFNINRYSGYHWNNNLLWKKSFVLTNDWFNHCGQLITNNLWCLYWWYHKLFTKNVSRYITCIIPRNQKIKFFFFSSICWIQIRIQRNIREYDIIPYWVCRCRYSIDFTSYKRCNRRLSIWLIINRYWCMTNIRIHRLNDALRSHGVKPAWGFHKVKLRKVETWRHAPGFQL